MLQSKIALLSEAAASSAGKSVSFAGEIPEGVRETPLGQALAAYYGDAAAPSGAPFQRERLLGKRVLLFEPIGPLRDAIRLVLAHEFLECRSVFTESEGLEKLHTENFDCVVLTCQGDFLSLAQKLRTIAPKTPRIALEIDAECHVAPEDCKAVGLDVLVSYPLNRLAILEASYRILVDISSDPPKSIPVMPEPGLIYDTQLENFDNDWEFLLELLDLWVVDSEPKMTQLLNASRNWDIPGLKSVSHSLKGCSYAAGLMETGHVYARIDKTMNQINQIGSSVEDPNHGMMKQLVELMTTVAIQDYFYLTGFCQQLKEIATIDVMSALEWAGSMERLELLLSQCLQDGVPPFVANNDARLAESITSQQHLAEFIEDVYTAALSFQGDASIDRKNALRSRFQGLINTFSLLFGSLKLPHPARAALFGTS